MKEREVEVLPPAHTADGVVRLPVALSYLRGAPVAFVWMTPTAAVKLAHGLLDSALRAMKVKP